MPSYYVTASSGTTNYEPGIALSFVFYEISRHPEAQRRLQNELSSLTKSMKMSKVRQVSDFPLPGGLESLPYLAAVIKESPRLRGTVPLASPRLTSQGKKMSLCGYQNIPSGVRVNTFGWCLHRHEAVFPNCDAWRPERWLGDHESRKEQHKWFWAFSSGNRTCIGENLFMESK